MRQACDHWLGTTGQNEVYGVRGSTEHADDIRDPWRMSDETTTTDDGRDPWRKSVKPTIDDGRVPNACQEKRR